MQALAVKLLSDVTHLAPVVQTLDSAIHRIKIYPLDGAIGFRNTYPLDSDLSGGKRYPTFEQPRPDVCCLISDVRCLMSWVKCLMSHV